MLGVVNYANISYVRDFEDNKSISGYCFFLKGAITIWSSKQQQTILTSTSKTKYVAVSYTIREVVWIRQFLNKLLPKQVVRRIEILEDNETSLTLTKNPKS